MAGLPEPQIFGKYHLVDKIATGGMAEVFRAKSYGVAGFEKTLVIKKILPNLASDKKFVEMFIDEAKIASTLSHINVVQIFDLGSEDGDYFIAMEYVDGTDLKTLVEKARQARRPVPVNLMAYIISEVAKGLDYAHRRKDTQRRDMNIVHRDISPHNVLVSHAGEVKITDFGIARASSKVNITRSGVIRGKFAYMSPEQARGDHIDRRSDIFSLGIVIYELVTATRLFKAKNDLETLKRVQTGPITPPSRLNPEVNPELESIILKALDRDRDRRYQFSSELYDDLSSYLFSAGEKMGGSELSSWVQKVLGPQDETDERTTDFDAFVNAIEELGGGKPKETRLTPLSAESIARKRARSASADEPTRLDPKVENSKLGSSASGASAPKSQPSQPAKPLPSRWTPDPVPKPVQPDKSRPRVEVELEEEDRPSTTRATQAVALKAPPSSLLAREGRLVGRTDELKRIREILGRVARGEGQTLVLTGEDGVGKTRLLTELQTFSRELDVAFYLARARKESSSVPYAALREVLGTIVGVRPGDMEDVARERIMRLAQLGLSPAEVHFVGALFGQHFTGSSVEEFRGLERRHAMLGAVEKIVHGLARERPMIVAVDDLENADELTRVALDHIASGLGTEPVLVLVTSTEEPRMTLAATTGRFHRVHLKPLSEFSAAILARSVLDVEDLGSSIANLVQARSGGNPLRVREAIRFLLASGALKVSRGRVLLDGAPESLFVPATGAMLAADAIAKLPDPDRRVIAVAAAIGERFDERMVAAVAGAEVTVDALARAESAGLVRPEEDGETESGALESGDPTRQNWRFTHRVFREAAANALPKDQAASLHLAIAEQTDRLPVTYRFEVLPSLWNHFAAAGKVERALEALDRATEMLLIEGGGVELIPSAEAACNLLADVPLGMDPRKAAGLRCKAWLRLADLLVATGENRATTNTVTWLERARSALDRARTAAESSDDVSLMVRVERAFGNEAVRRGQPERAVEHFDRARRIIEDDLDTTGTQSSPVRLALQRELVELEVACAAQLRVAGDVPKALRRCKDALDRAIELRESSHVGECHDELAAIHERLGEHARATKHWGDAIAIWMKIGDRYKRRLMRSFEVLANVHMEDGDFEHSKDLFREALELGRETGDIDGTARLLNGLARAHLKMRQYAPAQALFVESQAIAKRFQLTPLWHLSQIYLAALQAYTGDLQEGIRSLETTLAAYEKEQPEKFGLLQAELLLGNAYKLARRVGPTNLHYVRALGLARELGLDRYVREITREMKEAF